MTMVTGMDHLIDEESYVVEFYPKGNCVVIDNCATHHIYNDELMFILLPVKYNIITINGATVIGNTAAVGDVRIIFNDN